ncbi:MAG: GNAT family N-acetyltransferase [Acidimicrobiaceae bacterium]|nr:GNAT family N-acetyltransferase [Acidimicrobiaceae bacterium]
MALTQLTIGDARFRAGSWRGRADLATLVPLSAAWTLDRRSLSAAREMLQDQGFRAVVTAAVAPPERAAFLRDDFSERERLHLLRYDLQPGFAGGVPRVQRLPQWRRPRPRTRRGTRRDWDDILTIDGQSFDEFWRFDRDGLEDSITATPSSRLRTTRRSDLAETPESDNHNEHSSEIVGYALVGHAGGSGYLQRLAVHPAVRRQGIGTLLVNDALAWARRRGAKIVWVNTQKNNRHALRLYQKIGFSLQDQPLTVMYRTLT